MRQIEGQISSASARLVQKNGAVDRSYREDEREEVRKGEKVERGSRRGGAGGGRDRR
jgi:hypothetical protein